MTDEIALFIDFENIRYSLINVQRREPDPQELIALARRFGTVMVARAYADWARQPEFFKGSLTAAMIDRVDCPSKVRERFRQPPQFQHQGPYVPGHGPMEDLDEEERFAEPDEADLSALEERDVTGPRHEGEATELAAPDMGDGQDGQQDGQDEQIEQDETLEAHEAQEDAEQLGERRSRIEIAGYNNNYGYTPGYSASYVNGGAFPPPVPVITQSTVDLNMLMDIIETVFDRPSIGTFILMSGDRDFTRICARLKLRLNKRVIVVGVPGTVSRDLISAAEQFIPLGVGLPPMHQASYHQVPHQGLGMGLHFAPQGPVEPEEPGFIQFLDYIDRHWSWRTVGGVANFIGDPYNPKNRFRGRLTRDSARDLLRICIDEGILIVQTDATGSENLRLNRTHPSVEIVLNDTAMR